MSNQIKTLRNIQANLSATDETMARLCEVSVDCYASTVKPGSQAPDVKGEAMIHRLQNAPLHEISDEMLERHKIDIDCELEMLHTYMESLDDVIHADEVALHKKMTAQIKAVMVKIQAMYRA